jgi:homoserine O-acetyltransferase
MLLIVATEAADKLLDTRLAAPFPLDANDVLYMGDASRDYNPAPGLERIQAAVLAINSADDERNPPETGIMERELKGVKNARLFLIPNSEETRGHITTLWAKFWKLPVQEFCRQRPVQGSNAFARVGGARALQTAAQPMSHMGHSRRRHPSPRGHPCPLRP